MTYTQQWRFADKDTKTNAVRLASVLHEYLGWSAVIEILEDFFKIVVAKTTLRRAIARQRGQLFD